MANLTRRGLLCAAVAAPVVPYLPKPVIAKAVGVNAYDVNCLVTFQPLLEDIFYDHMQFVAGMAQWPVFGGGDIVEYNGRPCRVTSIVELKR